MISARMKTVVGPRLGTAIGVGEDEIDGGDSGPPPVTTTLTVAILDSLDPVISHVNFDYTVVVTNTGGVDATNVVATITLDSSLTYVSSSGTGWATGIVGQVVTCTRATLAVGVAPAITVTVTTADAASTETTTADADADNSDQATQDSETTVVALVDRDATSGRRYPSSATQWSDFNAYHVAIGTANFISRSPTHGYGCQEASGNLIDQIGSMNLAAAGTPLYSQAVAGHTRVGVGFNATLNQRFSVGLGTGPNPTLTPVAMLGVFTLRTVGVLAAFMMITDSAAHRVSVIHLTGGALRTICNATNNDGTVDHRDGAAHPVLLAYDAAATTVNRYTDLEKDNGTFAAGVLDGTKGIGAQAAQSSNVGECAGFWIFEGTDAQFTDASAKAFLGALNWSGIPWS